MAAHRTSRGFTLVELLVVIAIIAILSTIGMVIYSDVQKKARMSKRIGDLKAIQSALEVYYSVNKSYPTTGGSSNWRSECANWGSYASNQVIPGLVPTYMPSFPADPQMKPSGNSSCYLYTSDGVDYKVLDFLILEFTSADWQSQRNLIDPNRDAGANLCIVDGAGIPGQYHWAVWSSATSACW